jgi:hypothetical protein
MNKPVKIAETVGDVLDKMDETRVENMRVWNAVCRTDPKHTKPVEFGRKFTAIDAHYQIQEATRMFGPVGEGWGYETGAIAFADGLVIVPVTLWHGNRDQSFGPIYGSTTLRDRKGTLDKDAPKKATTDALTKALSQLGFNADVFLGKFDDNKYVAEVNAEFHPPAEPKVTPKERETDWAPTTLKGAIKALVHSLNGCGSASDFDDLMGMPETKETVEQCQRRFPAWWETGEGMPAEFRPLKFIIEDTKRGLKELAEMETR